MKAFHEHRKFADDLRLIANSSGGMEFLAHWQDEIEMMFVLEGSQKMGINNRTILLSPGDVSLIAPGDIHYYAYDGPARAYMLIFPADILAGFRVGRSCIWRIGAGQREQAAARLERIVRETADRGFGYELTANGLLHLILADLYRPAAGSSRTEIMKGSDTGAGYMQQVLSHIEQNYREPLTRAAVANHFNLSTAHFSRLFKTATGITFTGYLARLRLDKACSALRQTDLNVTDIAYNCGFESVRTFNRVFLNYLGCRPSDLRA